MRRLPTTILAACMILSPHVDAFAQNYTEAKQLFGELQDQMLTDQAAEKLRLTASRDADTRQYLALHLPTLISESSRGSRGSIWINSIRLAGNLKISEAVSGVAELLKQPSTKGGPITFTGELTLEDDPAAKALAEIGEPAVIAVGKILDEGDKSARQRAFLVLLNMNSPGGDQVLSAHLRNESDPDIKQLIQRQLQNREK